MKPCNDAYTRSKRTRRMVQLPQRAIATRARRTGGARRWRTVRGAVNIFSVAARQQRHAVGHLCTTHARPYLSRKYLILHLSSARSSPFDPDPCGHAFFATCEKTTIPLLQNSLASHLLFLQLFTLPSSYLPVPAMAFIPPSALPLRRHRPSPLPRCPSSSTTMLEQTTLIAVGTALLGLGGGIGLVAWTENQGKRTLQRPNVQKCVECRGQTTIPCTVCAATGENPLDKSKYCSYCDGAGRNKCFNCAGSGIQPRFLDRLSPEDFMD